MKQFQGKIPLPVIDLFAGVGGLSLGCSRAGFELRLAVESDRIAMAAHRQNFPNSGHLEADIGKLDARTLLTKAGIRKDETFGLVGGPPCQGFSNIGLRKAQDPRNELFARFFKLVQDTRPAFFLAENVPGIMSTDFEDIRGVALSTVKGYTILKPIKARASDYGAPTNRTRILFFGYRTEAMNVLSENDFLPSDGLQKVRVGTALLGLPTGIRDSWNTDDLGWRKIRRQSDCSEFWNRVYGCVPKGIGDQNSLEILRKQDRVSGCIATIHCRDVVDRFAKLGPGETDSVSRLRRLNEDEFCPTIRAGTAADHGSFQAVRPIHPTENRVITPREAARLQGFPDWYRFDPSKWHSFRQIGNSVSPIFAEEIMAKIMARIELRSLSSRAA